MKKSYYMLTATVAAMQFLPSIAQENKVGGDKDGFKTDKAHDFISKDNHLNISDSFNLKKKINVYDIRNELKSNLDSHIVLTSEEKAIPSAKEKEELKPIETKSIGTSVIPEVKENSPAENKSFKEPVSKAKKETDKVENNLKKIEVQSTAKTDTNVKEINNIKETSVEGVKSVSKEESEKNNNEEIEQKDVKKTSSNDNPENEQKENLSIEQVGEKKVEGEEEGSKNDDEGHNHEGENSKKPKEEKPAIILSGKTRPVPPEFNQNITYAVEDTVPETLDPKKPKIRELFQIVFNQNFQISGLALVYDNNDILLEKRYMAPLLADLDNPPIHVINKKQYFFIPGRYVTKLSEDDLFIDVNLDPSYFNPQSIQLEKQNEPLAEPITAFYVNYNFNASFEEWQNYSGSFGTGFMHKDNWLIRSDFSLSADKEFYRGNTVFIYELENKHRLFVGDTSGVGINGFGSPNFLGFRLSSPYYANTIDQNDLLPTVNVNGFSVNPSKLDIYINDKLYQSTEVAAGKYNLDVPLMNETGLGMVKAVVYDRAGNPQIIEFPFFADPTILKAGTFEYDVSAGFLRRSDGRFFSYSYNDPVINGLFTYGVNNRWTQQLYVQLTKDFQAISGTANFIPFLDLGKVSAGLSVNSLGQTMGQLQYSQANEFISYGVNYQRALNDDMFCAGLSPSCMKDSFQLYTGFKLPNSWGSFNATYTKSTNFGLDPEVYYWHEQKAEVLALNYNKNIMNGLSLNASVSKSKTNQIGASPGLNAYIGLNYSIGRSATASTSVSSDGEQNTYQQQLSINENPDKPWLGYGGITSSKTGKGEVSSNFFYAANLSKIGYQVNGTHSKTAGFSGSGSFAGSVYYLPEYNKIGLAREINSGLALVEVKDTGGIPIPISYENKLAGFTDKNGLFVVPNISPNNVETIAVDINKMPYNVTLMENKKSYRVPSNGTAKVTFQAKTNPYLVRIFGLPSGYVFKVKDEYYAVGEQGRATLETEGPATIEYSEGKFCEVNFSKDIKSYYCNEPDNEMFHIRDSFKNSSMKHDRKESIIIREYKRLMDVLGKEYNPEFLIPKEDTNKGMSEEEQEEKRANIGIDVPVAPSIQSAEIMDGTSPEQVEIINPEAAQ